MPSQTPTSTPACFTQDATAASGRIHLPVAARSNVRRKYGEPEVPGRALSQADAVQWLERVLAEGVEVTMVGITGPGDPLADPAVALATLREVRAMHPELALTLATGGLCAPGISVAEVASALAEIGLSHVTVHIDAVDPDLVEKLFAWIRPSKRTLALHEAAQLLLDAQSQAIRAFRDAGLSVKVNMTVYSGINEDHVPQLAGVVRALGAELLALLPYHPTCCEEGQPKPPTAERMATLREQASRHITVLPGNQTCAQGLTGMEPCQSILSPFSGSLAMPSGLPTPSGARVNVAVASSNGLDVDLHLGQAIKFLIFGPREEDGLPSMLGSRTAPEPGGGDLRWTSLAETLSDCFAILAASAGQHPRDVLAENGLTVITGEAEIQGAVDALFGGGKKRGKRRIKAN